MGSLQNLARLKSLTPANLVDLVFKYLRTVEEEMAQMNRDQIFKSSSDIFGNPLGYYSRATEIITTSEALLGKKVKIKIAGEPYDFDQTGTFLKGVYAKASDGFVSFGSVDPKTDDILDNPRLLSKSFFGLSEDHQKKIIFERILPYLTSTIRTDIGI